MKNWLHCSSHIFDESEVYNKIQIKSKPDYRHNRIVVRAIFAKYLAGGIRGGKRGSRNAEWTE